MGVNRTSILVIMVAGALMVSVPTMSLQQAFGINTQTQTIRLDNSACKPGSTCNNTVSQHVNFVGASDKNFATEDINSKNACEVGSICSNDASQFLSINGDGNRATLNTPQEERR